MASRSMPFRKRMQRAQILPERIAFRIDRRDADIRRDFGKHLVGGEEQLVGAADQHDLLRRMSAAGQDVEFAAADAQRVAGDQAMVGRRQARQQLEIGVTAGDDALRRVRVEPVIEIEAAIVLGFERARIEMQIQALQIFSGRHVERHAEPLQQEARRADMIGMKVRGDDARQRTVSQHRVEQRVPRRPTSPCRRARYRSAPIPCRRRRNRCSRDRAGTAAQAAPTGCQAQFRSCGPARAASDERSGAFRPRNPAPHGFAKRREIAFRQCSPAAHRRPRLAITPPVRPD